MRFYGVGAKTYHYQWLQLVGTQVLGDFTLCSLEGLFGSVSECIGNISELIQ